MTDDFRGWDDYRQMQDRVMLLSEENERMKAALAEMTAQRDMFSARLSETFAQAMENAEVRAALAAAEAALRTQNDLALERLNRALAAEAQRDALAEALEWCIEGFEGHFGEAFWQSPLGLRLKRSAALAKVQP